MPPCHVAFDATSSSRHFAASVRHAAVNGYSFTTTHAKTYFITPFIFIIGIAARGYTAIFTDVILLDGAAIKKKIRMPAAGMPKLLFRRHFQMICYARIHSRVIVAGYDITRCLREALLRRQRCYADDGCLLRDGYHATIWPFLIR